MSLTRTPILLPLDTPSPALWLESARNICPDVDIDGSTKEFCTKEKFDPVMHPTPNWDDLPEELVDIFRGVTAEISDLLIFISILIFSSIIISMIVDFRAGNSMKLSKLLVCFAASGLLIGSPWQIVAELFQIFVP